MPLAMSPLAIAGGAGAALAISGSLGLTSSLFALCAFVAWPVSSIFLVGLTWMGPSSLRLQGESSLASCARALVLGPDVRSLQVCILAFIARGAYLLLEQYVLYDLPIICRLTPIASVAIGVGSIGLIGPRKERIHDAGRALYSLIEQQGFDVTRLPASFLTLPGGAQGGTALPVAMALAVGMAWAGAPWLLGWVLLPLLRVALMLYASLSSLVAIYTSERRASPSELREWILYWMLGSICLPVMRLMLPLVLFMAPLTKDALLFGLRCFLLVDRGVSIPHCRRSILALRLFAMSVPIDDLERGRWERLHHELSEAWRSSINARGTDEGADGEIRRRWRDAAALAVRRATPPPSRQPSCQPSAAAAEPSGAGASAAGEPSADAAALPAAECCVLFVEIARGEARATCPAGHCTCVDGFARLFSDALDRKLEELSAEERACSRYMPRCAAADCGAHFGLREVTTMLTEEQAVAWEGSNKELFKQLHLEEWIRQNEAQGAEAKRIEEIRASFRNARGEYRHAYQCPVCRYGPKCLMACDDLEAHHGDEVRNPRTGEVTRINNGCTNCGWFGRHISMWEPWDGTVPPLSVDDAPAVASGDARGVADVPPTPAQEMLVGMGYSLEAIRQGFVLRAMARARRRRTASLQAEVEAGIGALEGEDDYDDDDDNDDEEEEEEEAEVEEEEEEEEEEDDGTRPAVGDRVRIINSSDTPTRPYVGQTGVMVNDDRSERPLEVRFDDGQQWWFRANEVRLVDGATNIGRMLPPSEIQVTGGDDQGIHCSGTFRRGGLRNGGPCYSREGGGAIYFDGRYWKICGQGSGHAETGWNFSQRGSGHNVPIGRWQASLRLPHEIVRDYSMLTLSALD